MRYLGSAKAPWLRLPQCGPRSTGRVEQWAAAREHVTRGFVGLLFTVYLFYMEPSGYNVMDAAKGRAFYIFSACFAVAIACTYFLQCTGVRQGFFYNVPFAPPDTSATIAIVIASVTWVSAFLSDYWPSTLLGVNGVDGAITISLYLLIFVIVSHFVKVTETLYYLIGVVLVLFCFICTVQMCDFNIFYFYQGGTVYSDYLSSEMNGQFLSTIGNSNLVAIFLATMTAVLLVALHKMTSQGRWLLITPIAMSLIVLCKIWVLLGLVGLLGGLYITVPILVNHKYRKLVVLLQALLLFAALVALYFTSNAPGVFGEVHQLLHGKVDLSFGSSRLYIWRNLLQDMQGHWFLGHGPDSVVTANVEPFTYVDQLTGEVSFRIFTDAHNAYLNILYNTGLLGLLPYLFLLMRTAYYWARLARHNAHVAALGAGIACWAIASFFCISHYIVGPFLWCLLGLFESEVRRSKEGNLM